MKVARFPLTKLLSVDSGFSWPLPLTFNIYAAEGLVAYKIPKKVREHLILSAACLATFLKFVFSSSLDVNSRRALRLTVHGHIYLTSNFRAFRPLATPHSDCVVRRIQ